MVHKVSVGTKLNTKLIVAVAFIFAVTGLAFTITPASSFISTVVSKTKNTFEAKFDKDGDKDMEDEEEEEVNRMIRGTSYNTRSYEISSTVLSKIYGLKNARLEVSKRPTLPAGCTNYKRQMLEDEENFLSPGDVVIGPNNTGILYDIVDNQPSIVEVSVDTVNCKVSKILLFRGLAVSTAADRRVIANTLKGWMFAAELQSDGRLKVHSLILNTYQACQNFVNSYPLEFTGLLTCFEVETNITKYSYNKFDIYIPQGLPSTYGGVPFTNNPTLLATVLNAEAEQCYDRLTQLYAKQLPVIQGRKKIAIILRPTGNDTGNNIVDRMGYGVGSNVIDSGLSDAVAVQNFLLQPRCLGTQLYAELNDMFGITDMPFWMMEGFASYDDQTVLWPNPVERKNNYLASCAANGFVNGTDVQPYFNQSSSSQAPNSRDAGTSAICFWIDVERMSGRAGVAAVLQASSNLHEMNYGNLINTAAILNPIGGQNTQTVMARYGWPIQFRVGNGLSW